MTRPKKIQKRNRFSAVQRNFHGTEDGLVFEASQHIPDSWAKFMDDLRDRDKKYNFDGYTPVALIPTEFYDKMVREGRDPAGMEDWELEAYLKADDKQDFLANDHNITIFSRYREI